MNQDLKPEKKDAGLKRTAVIILVALAVMAYLLYGIFKQYYNSVIDSQKNQLLIIAQEVSKELEMSVERNLKNVDFLVKTKDYETCKEAFLSAQDPEPFHNLFDRFEQSHAPYIANMAFLGSGHGLENPWVIQKQEKYEKISDVSTVEGQKVALWKDSEGDIAMSVMAEDMAGSQVYVLLDVQVMYEKMVSKIRLGDKGYVMVKDSGGIIIMHVLKEQLGIDVIEDRKRMYPDLNIENTSLEGMINNQKQGKEGVEIYSSYWWADENPSVTKKISAYTPAGIGDGFLIVSAVIDYGELSEPLTMGVAKIVGLSLVIFLGLLCLLIIYTRSLRSKQQVERENETLNELNQTLKTLHENEQIMAHQQRLQIIGTMTGGIAHEFNNLLTPIMGYAGLMMEMMDKNSEFYEDVTEIYDSAEKAKEIIHQISTLSKRNMDTVYQYCDVTKLLERVRKMAESIKPANVEIKVAMGEVTKGIFGNVTQLNQVILNLIVNAIHAIGDNPGQISIEYQERSGILDDPAIPQAWKQGKSQEDRFGQLSITDNGCGMDENTLHEIFEPFFTTKSSTGGTGLGLSIVQNIVESHKGVVLVDSHPGRGTTFRLLLPIADKPAAKQLHLREGADGSGNQARVLLVDDNPKVLKVLEKGLAQAGFTVSAEADPVNALRTFKQEEFDIVVTDDAMKEWTGLLLASRIRRVGGTIPIIVFTGLLRKEIIEAKQSGIIEEYMIKPVSVSSLTEVISALLKKRIKS